MRSIRLQLVVAVVLLFAVSVAAAPADSPPSADAIHSALVGKYSRTGGDRMEIDSPKAVRLLRGGKVYKGSYELDGEIVTVRINNMRKKSVYRFGGAVLFGLEFGDIWRKDQSGSSDRGAEFAAVASQAQWFASAGNGMGPGEVTIQNGSAFRRERYTLEKVVLWDCHLSFHTALERASLENGEWRTTRTRQVAAIDLRDLDLASAAVHEVDVPAGEVRSKPMFEVAFAVAADRGNAVLMNGEDVSEGDDPVRRSSRSRTLNVLVGNEHVAGELAERVLEAGSRCGASGKPNVQMAKAVTPSGGVDPTPAEAAAITNEDVTGMLKSGLSEVVVVAFINQSPRRNFKLDPATLVALKAAKVPDAVVAAMLAPPPAAVAAAAAQPAAEKPKSKYDPALTAAAKKAAVPPALRACEGIELMGLRKNEIFDRAMGGGVVEWLAQIRNNTGVTKIVGIAWRDSYGKRMTAQVEVGGGQIALSRLDLTQAKLITPVANLQLVSCE